MNYDEWLTSPLDFYANEDEIDRLRDEGKLMDDDEIGQMKYEATL